MATKEWVIIATERARRPEEFKSAPKVNAEKPSLLDSCPFCPSKAHSPEKAIVEIRDAAGGWKVKVIPNKYPALTCEGNPVRVNNGVNRMIDGIGIHEVIIETPLHNETTALYTLSQIEEILRVYRTRFREIEDDPRMAITIVYKNHGEAAGSSIEHPHSQLVATPVVPTQVRHRVEEAMRYYDDTGECVYCKMAADEIRENKRVVIESTHFVTIVPFAAYSPFHQWILPKRHRGSMSRIDEEEISDLAVVMKRTMGKLYHGLGNPDFNYCIRVAPSDLLNVNYFHWYIAIVPRLTKAAGFEMGTGMFINSSLPEENARFLRDVDV